MLDLGALKISVEVDSSKAKSELNNLGSEAGKSESKFGKFKSGLLKATAVMAAVGAAAVVVGKKIKGLADGVAQYGDTVDKNSQKMGISAEAYQKWDYVLQRNGSSINALKTGMKTFTSQIESGGKAFDTLGVKTKNADGSFRDTTDVLNDSITALAGMEDGAERTALANELFGKRTAQELLPTLNSGADGIKELQDRAEELGIVMSDDTVKACADYEDAMLDVQESMQGLRNSVLAPLLPYITKMALTMANTVSKISKWARESDTLKKVLDGLSKVIKTVVNFMKEHSTAMKVVVSAVVALVAAMKVWSAITKAITIAQTALNIVLSANPIGLIILAIVALVAAFVTAYKNSEKFRKFIDKLWSGIKKGVAIALAPIKKFGEVIKKVFTFVKEKVDAVKKSWDAVIKQPAKKVYSMAQKKFDEVKKKAKAVWNQWKTNLSQTGHKVFSVAKKGFETVVNGAKNVFNRWKTNLAQRGSKSYSVAKSGFEALVSAGKSVYNKWKDILGQRGSKTFEVIKKGFSTVLDSMKSVWSKWKDILGMNSKKHFSITSSGKVPGKRIGLREVPYDGYTAELHKGEAILTAAETNQYRNWLNKQAQMKEQSAQPQFQATAIDYDKLASTMINALSGMNINTDVNLNGRTIAQATAPFMRTEINTLDRRANRALGVV